MGRVFVAGSINMDVVATAERHPHVGETVAGKEVLYFPGGKGANQAVAAAKLGAATALIGRLGKDAFGAALRRFLADQGVDLDLVRETDGAHTGTAIITLAEADNTIVVIPGANGLVTPDDVAAVPLAKGDIAVSQFEIPLPAIAAFFKRARAAGATTILNPAPARAMNDELLDLVDILILNETELGFLTGLPLHENDHFDRLVDAARSLQAHPAQTVCVTRGERGVMALTDDKGWSTEGRKVEAIDTTGAGDCFVGAAAAVLAHFDQIGSGQIMAALGYGNDAAAVCVQRMGAAPSMPTIEEVKASIGRFSRPARP
jgi:ribokinase